MRRVAILSDINRPITVALIERTLAYAAERADLEVVAFVTRAPGTWRPSLKRRARRVLRAAVVACSHRRRPLVLPGRLRLPAHVAFVTADPASGDEALRALLRDDLGVDVLVSVYYTGILTERFLSAFPDAVNFHPGALPRHRGVWPVEFAVYGGDAEFGFAFHRMSPAVDEGPVIQAGTVPVPVGWRAWHGSDALVTAAVQALPTALDRVLAGDPGIGQAGPAGHHTSRDRASLVSIARPDHLSSGEVRRRLHAFGLLRIAIDGTTWPVTRLRYARGGAGRLVFTCSDGVTLEADRLGDLPVRVFRLSRSLRRQAARVRRG